MANFTFYGEALERIPNEIMKLFRSLYKKAVGKKCSIRINKVCISENIFPIYTKFIFYCISQVGISLILGMILYHLRMNSVLSWGSILLHDN